MADKTKLLLLSRAGGFASELLKQLEAEPDYAITFQASAKDALEAMKTTAYDCLILNLEQFSFRQLNLIEQIRSLGYKFKIFVFADEILRPAADGVKTLGHVVIFGKRFVIVKKPWLKMCEQKTNSRPSHSTSASMASSSSTAPAR
jgi:DNA-binding NarL/FixJ family response regulator